MKSILKSLTLAPSAKKLQDYEAHFAPFFAGRDAEFDRVLALICEHGRRFGTVPNAEAVARALAASNDNALLIYLQGIAADPMVECVQDDTAFASHLQGRKLQYAQLDIGKHLREGQTRLAGSGVDEHRMVSGIDATITGLHEARLRLQGNQGAVSFSLHGDAALASFREHYAEIERKRASGTTLYYTLPFKTLERVRLVPGDLLFTGAFTSQGKSLLLRALSYHLIVAYRLNVFFSTPEMTADRVRLLFALLHASNRALFPDAPPISYDDYCEGRLTPEQRDFLFDAAFPDFAGNPAYGRLYVEQPGKSRYTLPEMIQEVERYEATEREIDVCTVDYLLRLYPRPPGRGEASIDDYNQLVKDFKTWLISHRGRGGKPRPVLGMSAAQLSRTEYKAALGNNGLYDLKAFRLYTEIECSSDIVLTTMMTPQMAALNQLSLQMHKYRDGAVEVDPVMLHVDHAYGYRVEEILRRQPADTALALQRLAV